MNGILLVDKPRDWTSFDVAAKLRGLTKTRRIGHSGTLDPMATGLLVMFLGRATRAVSFAEDHDKRYIASLRPGLVTDTQDVSGSVLEQNACSVTATELEEALRAFRGEIEQIPPMYSAIRVNGRRLYEIARRGGEIERKPRPVTIRSLELLGTDENGDFLLDVRCSKGTYVRTLCHDIGRALGCGACLSALRRIEVGAFSVEDAHTMDELIAAADAGKLDEYLLGVDALFPGLRQIRVDAAAEKKIRCGNPIESPETDGAALVYGPDGSLLMLGEIRNGIMSTKKNFFEL
jgi:tRNA pseudouridine55 synthase